MRGVDTYVEKVYCDIDNTLIYGELSNLMRKCWDKFHSLLLDRLFIYLLYKFKLYKVNATIAHIANNNDTVFLTARSKNKYTKKMLEDIFGYTIDAKDLVELRAEDATKDKINYIDEQQRNTDDLSKILIIDDNVDLILVAHSKGYSTLLATGGEYYGNC